LLELVHSNLGIFQKIMSGGRKTYCQP